MVKEFKIPWAAWRDPNTLNLIFPDKWDVSLCQMNGANEDVLSDEAIKTSIFNPLNSKKISDIAQGKETAVIVVDDMTRTTPVSRIIPYVLKELEDGNISEDNITILLAIGAHRPMNREDCIKKLGREVVEKYNIENHHPYENLTDLGKSSLGTPIHVNTTYLKAEVKIAISGVIPHPLAGFGGGAKIILPGVSGIKTLEANHSAGMRGIGAGLGCVTGVRKDIEEIVTKIGLDFSINLVFNEIGDISGISSGNFIDAHRQAMELAKVAYTTLLPQENNICFLNAFPEDSELNQSLKCLNILAITPRAFLEKDASIVLMSSSYEGKGYHSLVAETGAKLYDNFGNNLLWRIAIKKRSVYFYSPNITYVDLNHFFPKSVKLFNDWNELLADLAKRYEKPKVAIIPTSIQLC